MWTQTTGKPSIFELIDQFEYLDKLCEDAIVHQDNLARKTYSVPDATLEPTREPVEIKTGDLVARAGLNVTDLGFRDFRKLRNLAQTLVPAGLLSAKRRFLVNAFSPDISKITDLEDVIMIYRLQMGNLEHEILEYTPRNMSEAVAKLKFIAVLMLDGGDLEIDLFAYLVEECAFTISECSAGH